MVEADGANQVLRQRLGRLKGAGKASSDCVMLGGADELVGCGAALLPTSLAAAWPFCSSLQPWLSSIWMHGTCRAGRHHPKLAVLCC